MTTSTTASTTTTTTTKPLTTKVPTTTTTKSVPMYLTDLVFRSYDNFIVQLSNSNSQAFKSRAQHVESQLDPIYRAKYPSFINVTVLRFSPGSIITETQLAFNSTQLIPTVQEISETLFTAVIVGNVNPLNITPYSISVNGSIINMTTSTTASTTTTTKPLTTKVPTTTTTKSVPMYLTDLVFRSYDNFIVQLNDSNSQAFKSRAQHVESQLDPIYRAKYPSFINVTVLRFSPGSIITETQLAFNSTQLIPTVQVISETLFTAVIVGNVNPLNINPYSISVNGSIINMTTSTTASTTTTTKPLTTKVPTTTTTKSVPMYLTDLVFRSYDNFIVQLNDSNSQAFKSRAQHVESQLDPIYRAKYPSFINVTVLRFSPGSIITETQLAFNSTQLIPTVQEISETLFTAVIVGNVNPLNITPYSISVNGSIINMTTSTTASTTTTTTTMTTTTTTTRRPLTSTTKVPTTTTTRFIPVYLTALVFRSFDIFIVELSDPASQAFKSRAELVVTQLDPIYRAKYPSFIRVIVYVSGKYGIYVHYVSL
ncbi:mucin-5AC-like [Onychostoma macrolepis]|uniref:mucin-5AC-like n=1 Tax=Onychostoma macrolepis TaxID=369639 RepID=UPI00272C01FC|nr:mucin-5AC-like [Onychostoma macrolepis]